jgi:hypothetical protein
MWIEEYGGKIFSQPITIVKSTSIYKRYNRVAPVVEGLKALLPGGSSVNQVFPNEPVV